MNRQLLRLVSSQLRAGVLLPFGVRDERGQLLLAKGQTIASDVQLEALLKRGLYAERDEFEAAKHASAAADSWQCSIFDIWEQQTWGLKRLLASVDQADFPIRCEEFARQLISLIQRDPDIAIYLSVRQDARRLALYGLTHSLHTALVCYLMAQRMGWVQDRVRALVNAALTMNMTIIEIQGQFAVQGRLADKQRESIRKHPVEAVARLIDAGVSDEDWLRAVGEHHERPDGGGYPVGLDGPCEAAMVLRMADVFMAKISPREGRPSLSVQDSARQMFVETNGSPAASAIIKEYGIYPPGNFVRLSSGEMAVVIRRGPHAHAPVAAAITDKSGTPTTTSLRRDTANTGFAIKAALPETALTLRLPPERLYGLT